MTNGFLTNVYNGVFKRASSTVVACVIFGFFYHRFAQYAGDKIYLTINKGHLYEDIFPKGEGT